MENLESKNQKMKLKTRIQNRALETKTSIGIHNMYKKLRNEEKEKQRSLTLSLPRVTLTDFTLSNTRRFYSSMGNPTGVKG